MRIQKTKYDAEYGVDSGSRILPLVTLVAGAIFAFPAAGWTHVAEWTVYNTGNSGLPYNGVTGLAIDAQGNVWIGTGRWNTWAGGGLARFNGENWTVYNTANSGLPNNDHTGLAIDPEGNIWSGTEGGLAKFDGESWTAYHIGNSALPRNLVSTPSFDAQGNLWVGTWGGGLAKFDGADWTVYNTSNSALPHNLSWVTLIDADDDLWVGSPAGLTKFDGADWTVYNTSNSGLPHNGFAGLCLDSEGNLWMASNVGLIITKFDGENWTVYDRPHPWLPNEIWDLAIDAQDNKWIATNGGLVRFDGTDWTVYNTSNSGLPDDRLYCLAIDAERSIWIGTENGGLAVFRPQAVVDFNGDGVIDIKDLLRLIKSWGRDDTETDIGPTVFGDGTVDAADLEMLMSYWGQEAPDGTLRALWKLDEAGGVIASDSAGNGHGTVMGLPAWQPAGGAVGGALEFDGTTFVATDAFVNPSDGLLSVFAWVKGGAPGQSILSQHAGANWLLCDPAAGALTTELSSGGRSAKVLYSDAVITDGAWHRVGFVWDGASRQLYVDDVLVAEDTQQGLAACYGGLQIGCGKDMGPGTFWTGLIDDVRIYNRAVRP